MMRFYQVLVAVVLILMALLFAAPLWLFAVIVALIDHAITRDGVELARVRAKTKEALTALRDLLRSI